MYVFVYVSVNGCVFVRVLMCMYWMGSVREKESEETKTNTVKDRKDRMACHVLFLSFGADHCIVFFFLCIIL